MGQYSGHYTAIRPPGQGEASRSGAERAVGVACRGQAGHLKHHEHRPDQGVPRGAINDEERGAEADEGLHHARRRHPPQQAPKRILPRL